MVGVEGSGTDDVAAAVLERYAVLDSKHVVAAAAVAAAAAPVAAAVDC